VQGAPIFSDSIAWNKSQRVEVALEDRRPEILQRLSDLPPLRAALALNGVTPHAVRYLADRESHPDRTPQLDRQTLSVLEDRMGEGILPEIADKAAKDYARAFEEILRVWFLTTV